MLRKSAVGMCPFESFTNNSWLPLSFCRLNLVIMSSTATIATTVNCALYPLIRDGFSPHRRSLVATRPIKPCVVQNLSGFPKISQHFSTSIACNSVSRDTGGLFTSSKRRQRPAGRTRASVASSPAYDIPELDDEEPETDKSDFKWNATWCAPLA